jgi:Cu/Ag efflux pump CusA
MISAGVILAAGVAILPSLRGSFIPELNEGHFIVHVWSLPGTSLEESLQIGRQITQALLDLPFVRSVAQRVGRAEAYEVIPDGPSSTEVPVCERMERLRVQPFCARRNPQRREAA